MDNNSEQKIGMDENCVEQIVETKTENAELKNEEGMEEMSTSMDSNNAASDENGNKEQKSSKKSLKFGGWLPDVLDWFKRPELARTSLSTSSYIFNRYCWPKLHGRKVKPRIVPYLAFSRERDEAGNWQTILKKNCNTSIPIADINPPEYIIGFENINFWTINDGVLHFVDCIQPLLREDVEIHFAYIPIIENNPQSGPITGLMELLAPKTNKLEIHGNLYDNLNKFNQQFPGFINGGVQSICLYQQCTKSAADLLMEWLTTPREDGTPKMLKISFQNAKTLIDRVKEEFVRSKKPANSIIQLIYEDDDAQIGYEDFRTVNEATEEMLELKHEEEPNKYFLVRCKIDGQTTEAKIDDLEKQMKLESKTTIWIAVGGLVEEE